MPKYRPQSGPGKVARAVRGGTCNCALLGAAAFMLLGVCDALAGDAEAQTALRPQADELRAPAEAGSKSSVGPLFAPPLYMPGTYALAAPAEPRSYSAQEFRPRGRSVLETDSRGPAEDNLAFDTNIWQRLNEYRNHDRIRVLTLWESGASTVSLQTDRRFGPSLQWTSRLMNRGGATHGLLDQLLPASIFGSGSSRSIVGRSTSPPPSKAANPLSASHGPTSAMP
jgi:hypothetical protein